MQHSKLAIRVGLYLSVACSYCTPSAPPRPGLLACAQGFDAARVATVAFLETFRQTVDRGDRVI